MLEDRQQHPTVVRTSRGFSIAGTRMTRYPIMDCVTAGWPPKLILDIGRWLWRERIHYLATNDPDFERVPGIAVRQPE